MSPKASAPKPNARKDAACDKCGRAHAPGECPVVAEYHGSPTGFLKKYGS